MEKKHGKDVFGATLRGMCNVLSVSWVVCRYNKILSWVVSNGLRCTFPPSPTCLVGRQHFLRGRAHGWLFHSRLCGLFRRRLGERRRIVEIFVCRNIGERRVQWRLLSQAPRYRGSGDGRRHEDLILPRQFVLLIVEPWIAEWALPSLVILLARVVIRRRAEAAHSTSRYRADYFLDENSLVHRRALQIRCCRRYRLICRRHGAHSERLHRRPRQLRSTQCGASHRSSLHSIVLWLLTLYHLIATRYGRNVTHGIRSCRRCRWCICTSCCRPHNHISDPATAKARMIFSWLIEMKWTKWKIYLQSQYSPNTNDN